MSDSQRPRRISRRPRRGDGVLRRDPRAEREGAGAAGAPAHGAVRRVDPRALRSQRNAATGRIRIDRSAPASGAAPPAGGPFATAATAGAATAAARPAAAPRLVVDAPSGYVIAVPDLDRGRLTALDRDLFGAARLLADARRAAVVAVVAHDCRDDLGEAGADRVVRLQPPAPGRGAPYLPYAQAAAIAALAAQFEAAHLVFTDAPGGGADVGRRVAARLGMHPAVRVKLAGASEVVSLAASGSVERVRQPPRVLLVEAGCAEPVSGRLHEARELPAVALEATGGQVDLGAMKVDRSAVPLPEAELIVSAGAGVSDWPAFHALAARLGAAEAGSRVVCDLGHLPRDRQVGASGAIVEPRAYLALGISGAPQHLQGIARCERVVAVNADAHAPMIQRADLAIVGDVQRVMPALAALLDRQAQGGTHG